MDFLRPLVAGLVAAGVVYLLSKAVRREAAQRDGRQSVEYGRGYRLLAAVAFPLSAFVTFAALQASPDQIILALIIASLFWIGTLYLTYEFFFVNLSYDDLFIYHQTPLRGKRQIPWDAVTDVHYSAFTHAFTVTTDGYGNISVSPMADGSQAFIERVRAHVTRDSGIESDG
jgi:hypothetical protein